MVLLREHEAEADLVQQFPAFVGILRDVDAQGLLHVRRTTRGGGCPVPVLRDFDATGRRHQSRGRGNIETVCPVSAGPDDLQHFQIGFDRDRVFPHGRGASGDLRGRLGFCALGGERGEEGGVLGRAGLPAHDLIHDGIRLVVREILFVDDFYNGFFDHGSLPPVVILIQ